MTNHETIVGLDLSLASTGIAIHYGEGSPLTQRVRSTGKAGATWEQRASRLRRIVRDILEYIPPESLVIVEGPSYASSGAGTHDRAGLWWEVYIHLANIGCTIIPVSPAQRMKYATGKGGGKDAGKDNVLAAAIRTYPFLDITGNDIADAVIFMAIGCRLTGQPLEESLPKNRLEAMNKIELPETRLAA
jgi:crossover junction endodeoxyribonuclease RuvC